MRSRHYSIFDVQGVQTLDLLFKYKQKSQITPLKVKFYSNKILTYKNHLSDE